MLHEINEPFTQVYDSDFGFYRYSYDLVHPLTPQAGYSYWISVQAQLDYPPQWMWAESAAEYDWGAEGVFRSQYHAMPEWTSFTEFAGSYSELAFRIYSEDGLEVEKLPIVEGGWWSAQQAPNISYEAECADDFYFEGESPITRIEWWGGYTASPVLPQYFHLRIYGGTIVPTHSTTWGQVKALY
ncbi:MAG: hypothetical protein GY835_25510 [bacterium]|nr:hypothetical protein [bacterium]